MPIAETLAFNMKRLRKKKGWTQADLAEAMRASLGSVRAYENLLAWPGTAFIQAMAKALGVPEEELFKATNQLPITLQALADLIDKLEAENKELKNRLEKCIHILN